MKLQEAVDIILKELKIQNKELLGHGIYKKVFPYRKDENYVVKKFNQKDQSTLETIKKEVSFIETYKEICAKIIKVNYDKGWLIQEKLDVKEFLYDLKKCFDVINEEEKFERYDMVNALEIIYFKYSSSIPSLIKTNEKFKKFFSFFDVLKQSGLIKQGYGGNYFALDLQQGNLGYDKLKNIKLLDV